MLIEDRIKEWREADELNEQAIELLRQAEDELRRLRPKVSPGRPWELDDDGA